MIPRSTGVHYLHKNDRHQLLLNSSFSPYDQFPFHDPMHIALPAKPIQRRFSPLVLLAASTIVLTTEHVRHRSPLEQLDLVAGLTCFCTEPHPSIHCLQQRSMAQCAAASDRYLV
jgi:hypothetical protein